MHPVISFLLFLVFCFFFITISVYNEYYSVVFILYGWRMIVGNVRERRRVISCRLLRRSQHRCVTLSLAKGWIKFCKQTSKNLHETWMLNASQSPLPTPRVRAIIPNSALQRSQWISYELKLSFFIWRRLGMHRIVDSAICGRIPDKPDIIRPDYSAG